jgi:ADP-ribosylglycohydrolase
VVTALVVGLFAAAVLGLQAMMSGVTHGQTLAVAGSTLLAAVAVSPIRARVQRVVDRRFNRTRYDAERTVQRFVSRLRDQVDLQTLTMELDRTANETVQPSSSTIWLRGASALPAPREPRG